MKFSPVVLAMWLPILLTACGSEESRTFPVNPSIPDIPVGPIPAFNLSYIKLTPEKNSFRFSWDGIPTGLTYTVCVDDSTQENNCNPIASGTNINHLDATLTSLLTDFTKPLFILARNSGDFFQSSGSQFLNEEQVTSIIQYLKASKPDPGDEFGQAVAISDDGNTLVVSAHFEDSADINNQNDNSKLDSGAVYVFKNTATGWNQNAYLKSSNSGDDDHFGIAISISGDGQTIAVGATSESSNAQNAPENNAALKSGAVYVFQLNGETWTEQAYLKASIIDPGDYFGGSVSLSGDGNRLAVGARYEDSNGQGVDVVGDQLNNDASNSGAVYTFTRLKEQWTQESYIKGNELRAEDEFGFDVKLSAQGDTLAIGAYKDDANAQGANGIPIDYSKVDSGAVYLFRIVENKWQQQAFIKASNTDNNDLFGSAISLNETGTVLAVGAANEQSIGAGIDANQNDNSATSVGAVYLFRETDNVWAQEAYVKASNPQRVNQFGWAVSLNGDGSRLAVGSSGEKSNGIGLNGYQEETTIETGAAYLFSYLNGYWQQTTHIKAPNPGSSDFFGHSLSLSGDGNRLAVGAIGEDSNATGINGIQTNDDMSKAGAVYVY